MDDFDNAVPNSGYLVRDLENMIFSSEVLLPNYQRERGYLSACDELGLSE